MYRAGLVGCGNIGKLHAEILHGMENVELVGVCDVNIQKAEEYAQKYGSNNAGIYTSLDEMLEETKLDVLHICLPHYLHVKAAETAIENGVNVFMEKPPALTKDEFQTLKKKVQETKLSVGVCFQNRYNESVLEACSILKSGSMGKIKGARAFVTWSRDTDYYTRDRWHGSKSTEGGGVLINQAIHTLDLLTQFMGKPLKVEAEVKNYHLKSVIDVEDTVESYIEFENGPACFFCYQCLCGGCSCIVGNCL